MARVRQFLQSRIERRRHRQAAFVQDLRAVLPLEVLADFLDEERRDAERLVGLTARHDRFPFGVVGLRLRDVVLVRHPLKDDVAAGDGALHVDERTLSLGCLENPADERGFLEIQLLVRLVEVQARGGLDAVRAVPEIHLVAVDAEDLFLRVALLDLDGEHPFADLPLEKLLLGEAELIEVAGHLLRDGARALSAPPLDEVGEDRGEDSLDVQAEVMLEAGVFGRDDGLAQQRIDVVVPTRRRGAGWRIRR